MTDAALIRMSNTADNVSVKYGVSPALCRTALRRSTSYGGHPSHATSMTPLIFASKKKTTDSKPDGLPSVALAKDGGGRTNLTYDISTLKMAKDFQV